MRETRFVHHDAFLESPSTALTLPNVAARLKYEEHKSDALVLAQHVTEVVLCNISERSLQLACLS